MGTRVTRRGIWRRTGRGAGAGSAPLYAGPRLGAEPDAPGERRTSVPHGQGPCPDPARTSPPLAASPDDRYLWGAWYPRVGVLGRGERRGRIGVRFTAGGQGRRGGRAEAD